MVRKEVVVDEVQRIMANTENVRNIAIIAHVDHGKTTLTDSLVARAGLISKQLAGEQRMMDFDEQEQARGITIKSANISLGFKYAGKDHLINLIDTPGHVDFGGHVTRALRAVDGVCLVVDAVEGVMPQTETVLRQALKERAKPIVFINKVDRLINEMKLDQAAMQEKLVKVITGINKIILANCPPEFKKTWEVKIENANIAFGSAFHKWAVSAASMKRFNITFKDIYEKCRDEDHQFLVEKSPVDDVLLEMVIQNLPSPVESQKYRIPAIWKGDKESEQAKEMALCDQNGKTVGVCFGVVYDEHAGEVGVLRLFSGKISKGDQLYVFSKKKFFKVQQVGIYMGPDRVAADFLSAGNIGSIVGLKDIYIGETVASSDAVEPFEDIKHVSEPVVTKSIEAKESKDLAKLIEALRGLSKEDPTLRVTINQETGEHLLSGMGELHLEIIEYKISKEKGINIMTSPPIVVYRETITKKSNIVEGKSPNKHNKFKIHVEPLDEKIVDAIETGNIPQGKPKGKEHIQALVDLGMDRDEAKGIWDIKGSNMFVDATKGVQYLNEVQELAIEAFEEAMTKGPLAQENVTGVKVMLTDATLHEDNVHRGPAQVIPAVKRPIYACMIDAGVSLMEPKQKVLITSPQEYGGEVINMTNGRRGQLLNMEQEGETSTVHTILPVSELFGFSNALRGSTQGRATWYQEYHGYDNVPRDLVSKIVRQIRERKGLNPEPPTVQTFMD
ncbi:elongation factor EF-2 [Candidatus Micrarchaeota archaeon]|nr:elongation factor EF-2 [Candidatus Micrarchaeota archaeon]MBD3418033.1 elongation factor EF-2 [Candidatus Micrarchaeota archaeon]